MTQENNILSSAFAAVASCTAVHILFGMAAGATGIPVDLVLDTIGESLVTGFTPAVT